MRVCVAVLGLALLAGCGSQSDEQQITEVMGTLRATQDSGDAEKACEEVYVVQERGREPEAEGEEEGEGERARCEPAFERSVEQRKAAVERLKTKLVRVDVDGEQA